MILVIARKELKILFGSPLAWILLALVQLVLAWIFLAHLDTFLQIQPQLVRIANPPGATETIIAPVFAMAAIVLLMITPLLTARLIAEERRNHTMTFLISAPISMIDIVLGKFLGLMVFFSIMIMLVVMLSMSLLAGGPLDFGLLLSNVAGLFLIAACFASLGLYFSCLSAHPAIAAAGALGALLILWVLDIAAGDDKDSVTRDLSLLAHYENFNRGMIDTFDLAYFSLFVLVFLVLSIRRLDKERLRG
ncbi:ABC transporter permease [Nitrosospira sp. NpAV]|uniref:ABC transporter permease n=1 Tax=Nitrosospira sp. NpAV TaxID=58133 RepID=UPI0005A21CD7|nr:ABC transporter permease subunit [Nitrosospira sp. NpAV]KIO50297.1 ABC transporter permease [Nitrosospira sp. NpAV]